MSELGYLITQQVHKKMQVYNLHYLRLWFLHIYSRSSSGYLSWSLILSIDLPISAPSTNHKISKYTTAYMIAHHNNKDTTVIIPIFCIWSFGGAGRNRTAVLSSLFHQCQWYHKYLYHEPLLKWNASQTDFNCLI